MHPKAFEKTFQKVVGSLKNCGVEDGWPVYGSLAPHVQSLADELLKHKGQWLTSFDVFSVFVRMVYERLCEAGGAAEKLSGRLCDLLGEESLIELGRKIVDFYSSIPRRYEIYLPLPALSVCLESVEFSKSLSIVVFDNPEDVPGKMARGLSGLIRFSPEVKPAYLRFEISGYCSADIDNASVRAAISSFKMAIQQGIAKKILKTNSNAALGLIGLTHHSVEKVNLICVDKDSNGGLVINVEFPLEMSRLLAGLDIDASRDGVLDAIGVGAFSHVLHGVFDTPAALIEDGSPEAKRVKSAVEWCFDSYVTDNTTMSFLQACFGLEALFGDDTETDSVTRTLADRCAYLVSNNIKGRSAIREKFRGLYSVRSKIVHGNATSLAPEHRHLLNWGRSVLEYAIFKEIKHLELK